MRLQGHHWIVAIAASLVLHGAGAAAFMAGRGDEVLIEGGAEVEVSMLGDAFADAVSAGQSGEAVQPVEEVTETVEPVEPAPVTETVQPTRTVAPEATVQPPVETPVAEPAPAETPAEPVETARAETVPVEPLAPAQPSPSAEAVETDTVAPDEPAEADIARTIAALTNVPLPTARPSRPSDTQAARPQAAPRSRAKAVEPVAEPKPKKATPRAAKPRQAGNGGRQQADARRGSADGSAQSRSASSGDTGRSRQTGNAAISNYPGKIVSKLRRSLRYPAQARRERLRGEVHVAFTVSAGGGVSSVRVVRGSGSPVLDQAALETVRRAAPFPPIPQGAGRNSWGFTVPLAFTR